MVLYIINKARYKIKNSNKWLIAHYILTTKTTFTKVHIFHSLKSCNQIPLNPILESPNLANWFTTQKQIRNNELAVDRSSFETSTLMAESCDDR